MIEEIEGVADEVITDINNVIFLILVVIIKFYSLNLRKQELWKDILLNLVTSIVIKSNTYFIVYNILAKKLQVSS